MVNKPPPSYTLPISQRPPTSNFQKLLGICFIFLFDFGLLSVNATQFLLLPLAWIPHPLAQRLYDSGIRYTKGSFACLLILITQLFAPTSFHVTFETDGMGALSLDDIVFMAKKDSDGNLVGLNLPRKFVFTSNHQVYADWWYAWSFFYFFGSDVHKYVYITLKKSLKWVPVVGWGMQFFNFVFLARSWASDRRQLSSHLEKLGKKAEQDDRPFAFLVYPEGTLVSANTRPVSKKYADKSGIEDLSHTLLPRSTGLHYSLRALSPKIPDLKMLDVTMVYPGTPKFGYGQDYFTLRSMFMDGRVPPKIHIHVRVFDVYEDIPIGDLSEVSMTDTKPTSAEVDVPDEERDAFDLWLQQLWREKDATIERYYETGSLAKAGEKGSIEFPVELRRTKDILDAFCLGLPAALVYSWRKLRG